MKIHFLKRYLPFAFIIFIFPICRATPEKIASSALEQQAKLFNDYYNALPDLKPLSADREYTILIDYVHDPLLPSLTDESMQELFQRTRKYTHDFLKYRINLKLRRRIDIKPFFFEKALNFEHRILSYPIRAWYLDPDDPEFPQMVKTAIEQAVIGKPDELLKEYFGPGVENRITYINQIAGSFETNLREIYSEPDKSGRPLYHPQKNPERKLHLSFPHWTSIAFQERDTDFILTNSTIAGADDGMPIYVINRGGITSAFINMNEHRSLQGTGILGMYPMLSNGPHFRKVRGTMTLDESLDAIAMIWVHEFGHLLMRKDEIYNIAGSVHQAPRGLNYKEWVDNVKENPDPQSDRVPVLKKF